MKKSILLLSILIVLQTNAQQNHPSFMHQGNIYEVNIRQYTPEGTFNAFAKHIPRLKKMGVQTLWLMPIQPISKLGRKGTLGSYYAVADYTAINPEFGTMSDFNHLIQQAHALGMKVIIDYVPNHSGADHPWLTRHPDFYEKDSTGQPTYTADWSDTRELNFANLVMQDSMINTMKFWVNTTKIDGFRVDVAWGVPLSFWNKCVTILKNIRPLFFLAEADDAALHTAGFDATYTWREYNVIKEVAAGKKDVRDLDTIFNTIDTSFVKGAWRLYFTSNHDENSWNKADFETMPGLVHAPFAVLALTYNRTMPLIYSGQEEPVLRAIQFFEKDPIQFNKFERANFYTRLLQLRNSNKAFGEKAQFKRWRLNNPKSIMAYQREFENEKVAVVLNLSNQVQEVDLDASGLLGTYKELFTGKQFKNVKHLTLPAWGYFVFVKMN
ncbi:MAG: alpha-amylase family glycosyl hydrolase [Sediminibacterium sp.]|jgi:alpha-amylase